MSHDFDRACTLILELEGGAKMTTDPDDPGGATKYGISLRYLRGTPDGDIDGDGDTDADDIRALDEQDARARYLSDFWMAAGCDSMPWPLSLFVFDCAVNQGKRRAVRWLQRVLAIPEDGKLGPVTRTEARRATLADGSEFMALREQHYRSLPTFAKYGRGWMNRLARVKREGDT